MNKQLNNALVEFTGTLGKIIGHKVNTANFMIAGGAIASIIQNERPKDYDIYCTNPQYLYRVIRQLLGKLQDYSEGIITKKGAGVEINLFGHHTVAAHTLFITANSVTLDGKYSLITRFTGKDSEILSNFDFLHTKSAYWQGRLRIEPAVLDAIVTKRLEFTGSRFPLSALIRTLKFIKRGYSISNSEFIKLMLKVRELPLETVDIFKEQLLGFYGMYPDSTDWKTLFNRHRRAFEKLYKRNENV